MAKLGRRVDNFLAHLFAPAALWVRIQTSLKNTKWAAKVELGPNKNLIDGLIKACWKIEII